MSEIEAGSQEAKELGKRAAKQARHAARNAGGAVKAVAEPVAEEIREEAEEAVDAVVSTAKRVSPAALQRITGNAGQGFMALSVAIWAGSIAANKFGAAFASRKDVVN